MQNIFVVRTQILENYGAHCEDGKFSSGNAYWKAKGGTDYIVTDLDRAQDAMAFVMAAFSENGLGYKEFPIAVMTEQEWIDDLPEDEEYRDFLKETAVLVSPKTGRKVTRGYPEEW
jgi:hypothetical protein